MTYAQLAEHSEDAVREMCSFLKTDFDPDRLQHWWETDSHIIGGNNAILYQVNWPAWFDECDDYLDGKYRGRRREIFRDMAWASDTAFVDQCRKCYLKMGNDLEPLLRQLGHGGVDQQLSELSSP